MSKTKFVDKQKIGELIENIVTDRDVLSKMEYTVWESIYESVERLSEYLEDELKQWKGTKATLYHGGEALFQLKDLTTRFIEKCRIRKLGSKQQEITHLESTDFLDNYRKNCIPLIVAFAGQLESDHPLRIEIERILNKDQVPMMY
jgi:hypothetical protein